MHTALPRSEARPVEAALLDEALVEELALSSSWP